MKTLHQVLETMLDSLPERILAKILASKLEAQGLVLSKEEQCQLVDHTLKGKIDRVTLRSSQDLNGQELKTIVFTTADSETIGLIVERLDDVLPEIFESTANALVPDVLKALEELWPQQYRIQRRRRARFRRTVAARWGHAIERLQMLLTISRELGASINEEIRGQETNENSLLSKFA